MDKSEKEEFQDPYIDQDSGCLRNIFDIKKPELLSTVETAFASNRFYELRKDSFDRKIDKPFDFEHLKNIHKHIFQDVYEWAGQVRQVNISKGDTMFMHCSYIEQGAHYTFDQLKKENYLKDSSNKDFSLRTGYYLGEINHIHPFREGNGRTQRALITQLAHHNGYDIEWKNLTQKQMVAASIEAHKGNSKPLAELIHENLITLDTSLNFKQDRSYEGEYAKVSSPETGQRYDGKIIEITERHVMQELKNSSNHIILHDRRFLSKTPELNKEVEISYPHGNIGLVRAAELSKEKNISKNHDLGKTTHHREEPERER